jgi:hypothetical protein
MDVINIHKVDKSGLNSLQVAILEKVVNYDYIYQLLELGVDFEVKYDNGNTLLLAAEYNRCWMVSHELIRRGLDINATTREGLGVLHIACKRGCGSHKHYDMLLKNGADVNAVNNNGFSVFAYLGSNYMQMWNIKPILKAFQKYNIRITEDSFYAACNHRTEIGSCIRQHKYRAAIYCFILCMKQIGLRRDMIRYIGEMIWVGRDNEHWLLFDA